MPNAERRARTRAADVPYRTAPAVLAERLERATVRSKEARAERLAAHGRLLEELAGLPLDELRRHVSTRQWLVALYHIGGYDAETIARAVGYVHGEPVRKALKHPVVARLVELVRHAQLERLMRGEFGVAAQARAAAPAVMQHVTELAGAAGADGAGVRKGRAKRDADALRAAELVLTVSGDKVERAQTTVVHVLEELSEPELEALAERGEWPERYRGVAGLLPGPGSEGAP
jgi:hypothetical protein